MTGGQVIEVANYDRWSGYRGGQLYSFHCNSRSRQQVVCYHMFIEKISSVLRKHIFIFTAHFVYISYSKTTMDILTFISHTPI
jgi:hypothetical protein